MKIHPLTGNDLPVDYLFWNADKPDWMLQILFHKKKDGEINTNWQIVYFFHVSKKGRGTLSVGI
jgi:hypothetical protein